MSDVEAGDAGAVPPAVEEKKTKAAKGGKASPKKKTIVKTVPASTHPKYSKMITDAITSLKERNGSSRQAIVKYILANFDVGKDERTANNHVKMSLRASIKNGSLKQSKGVGASGSFKLGESSKSEKKPVKKASPSKEAKSKSLSKVKKPKAAKASKTVKAKAEKASPKKSTKKAKSPKKAAKTKSPKKGKSPKARKGKKSPAKKVKAAEKSEAADSGSADEEPAAESS